MIRGLDGFRALAWLAVFSYDIFDGFGYLGVPAFFVLSGFLITRRLIEMRGTHSRRSYFVDFYGRRGARIFPLYYAYLAMASALVLLRSRGGEASSLLAQLPWALTYTANLFGASAAGVGDSRQSLLGHLWSLSVEEQFYLVWPLLIYVVPAARLQRVLVAIIVAAPALRLAQYVWMVHAPSGWNPEWNLAVYLLTSSHLDAFAIGGLAASSAMRLDRATKLLIPCTLALVGIGYVTEFAATGGNHWSALGYPNFMADSWKFVWGYSAFNALIAATLIAVEQRTFLPRLFECAWLGWLGRISYGLYVYGVAVLWTVHQILPSASRWTHALVAVPATIVVSSISYYAFEQRFLRLKDKYFAHQGTDEPRLPEQARAA